MPPLILARASSVIPPPAPLSPPPTLCPFRGVLFRQGFGLPRKFLEKSSPPRLVSLGGGRKSEQVDGWIIDWQVFRGGGYTKSK